MYRKMHQYCLFIVLMLVATQKVNPLLCYECSTLFTEDECGEDFEPEGLDITECNGDDICMIHVTSEVLEAPEIIVRGCVEKLFCSQIDEWTEHCLTCEEDLCNSSSAVAVSFVVILIGFIVQYLL